MNNIETSSKSNKSKSKKSLGSKSKKNKKSTKEKSKAKVNGNQEPEVEPEPQLPYCTAEPGSDEWKAYQAKRLKSIDELKSKKKSAKIQQERMKTALEEVLAAAGRKEESSKEVSSILKSTSADNSRNAKRERSLSNDKIRWKVPIDDEEEEVPRPKTTKAKSKSRPPFTLTLSSNSKNVAANPTAFARAKAANARKSKKELELEGRKMALTARSNNRRNSSLTPSMRSSVSKLSAPKSKSPAPKKSNAGTSKLSQSKLKSNSLPRSLSSHNSDGRLKPLPLERTPPKFPVLKTCSVFPGTPEWDQYWENFNFKIKEYKEAMDDFGKGAVEAHPDFKNYSQRLKESVLADRALHLHYGIRSLENRAPILREPINEPQTMIGGYMIKRKFNSPKVLISLTSFDHIGFQLEIQFPEDAPLQELAGAVKIDNKYNTMIITLVDFDERITIGVPSGKKVDTHLTVGYPIYNNGRLIITGT